MKHFIDINQFTKKELNNILLFAKKIKKNQKKYSNIFESKSLGLLFEKQSTRTRLSFSIGVQKMGGHIIDLDNNKIGYGTRESKKDILKTFSQYLDFLIIRNNDHNEMIELSSLNVLPIINGLSNFSHPCQILSDIFTIEEHFGNIKNKIISWVGDFNNVLVSLIHASEIFNFKLNIVTPKELIKNKKNIINKMNLDNSYFYHDIKSGVNESDCIMTDAWISMGEKNIKNKKILLKGYQVNDAVMKHAKKSAIFMHCLPAHRNEEVTNSVIDGRQSKIWEQAKNRMFVQQSILNYLIQ
jgi:ornithine carbamoyltransferase